MITFKPIEEPEKEIKFPAHFRHSSGCIALAFDVRSGVIVSIPETSSAACKIGQSINNWTLFDKKAVWTQVPGETTFKTE